MIVYTKQYGGLGNRCFQKAAAIGYATKYGLGYDLTDKVPVHKYHILIKEAGHQYQELIYNREDRKSPIILDGYWQSAKYFEHCREKVRLALGFNWQMKKEWCSIHVRRGDYLLYPDKHPVVSAYYLITAIRFVQDQLKINKFMVFSDAIEWCKSFFGPLAELYNMGFEYSEGRTEREDFELMSCCEHNIISNSTFSWWAAYLNQNPNKVVISPSKDNWFGPGNAHLDTSDLIPDSWIQIKY